MGKFLNTLKKGSPLLRVVPELDGFSLVRTNADFARFDSIVQELVDHDGQTYVAFPSMDPHRRSSYERVFILPIEWSRDERPTWAG